MISCPDRWLPGLSGGGHVGLVVEAPNLERCLVYDLLLQLRGEAIWWAATARRNGGADVTHQVIQ